MWGYSIAAASLGIKHKLVGDFQVAPTLVRVRVSVSVSVRVRVRVRVSGWVTSRWSLTLTLTRWSRAR